MKCVGSCGEGEGSDVPVRSPGHAAGGCSVDTRPALSERQDSGTVPASTGQMDPHSSPSCCKVLLICLHLCRKGTVAVWVDVHLLENRIFPLKRCTCLSWSNLLPTVEKLSMVWLYYQPRRLVRVQILQTCVFEATVDVESVTHFGYEALFQWNMWQGSQAGRWGRRAAWGSGSLSPSEAHGSGADTHTCSTCTRVCMARHTDWHRHTEHTHQHSTRSFILLLLLPGRTEVHHQEYIYIPSGIYTHPSCSWTQTICPVAALGGPRVRFPFLRVPRFWSQLLPCHCCSSGLVAHGSYCSPGSCSCVKGKAGWRGLQTFLRDGPGLCLTFWSGSSDLPKLRLLFWIQRVHRVCGWC